jgi:hypothetical protein
LELGELIRISSLFSFFGPIFSVTYLICFLTQCANAGYTTRMGDTSVEDIYKEAERSEKDMDVDQLPPTGSTPSSPPGTGDQTAALGNQLDDPDEAASKALQECYKKFLASHSNKTVNVTDVPVNCVDSAQNGIKNLRIKNLGTQNLDIGFEKITVDLDGFKLSSKAWG